MKFKIASAALVIAAAGNAFAESPIIVNEPFVSNRTRADVLAELHAFKQGGVNPWSISYNQLRAFRSNVSRDQVVADYLASRQEVSAMSGEDSGSAYLAQGNGRAAPGTAVLASRSQPAR